MSLVLFRSLRRWFPSLSASCRTFAALSVLLSPLPAALAAASPQRFEDTSQVVSVEVPVQVVGKDGLPVRGLQAADFEVYDEGQKQALKSFRVVDLDQLQPAGALPGETEQLEPSARRHLLLLFDLSFARPSAVLRARQAARDFVLKSVRPTDLVGLATYSLEAGPRLVVTFTPDRAQLARGILTLGLDNAFDANKPASVPQGILSQDTNDLNSFKPDPLRFLISRPTTGNAPGAGGAPNLPEARGRLDPQLEDLLGEELRQGVDRADKSFGRNRVTSFARSMADLAKKLAAVKGRKQIILFSEGFDSRLLLGHETFGPEADQDNTNATFGDLQLVDSDNRFGNTELQGHLRRMLQEFRRADCVIQAVDIAGLTAGGDATDEVRPSGEEGLFVMANETGGELFRNANDFRDQLDRVLSRSTVTYLLSFERSDLKPNGAFRQLKVKAKLPAGARISYRAGYYAPRPFAQLDPLERSLVAADGIASAAPRTDLDVNLLVSPFRAADQHAYVPVIIEVGGERLLAGHKEDKLTVEFYTYVSDAQGEMKDFLTQKVALDVKKGRQAVLAGGVKYYGHLELPAGDYRVRVLVRDAETGRTGVQTAPLRVPAYAVAQPLLLPPFFMETRGGWVMVRERTADSGQGSVVYPFTVNGEPYVPAARPALAQEEQAKLCLVGYNLGSGQLEVRGRVTAADGQPMVGGSLGKVERTATGVSGLDKLLATFRPTGLGAGSYVLQVAVKDPKTGREETNSVPFEVIH
jgi:VWFA-related protein